MRLYEHEGKALLADHGFAVPRAFGLVRDPRDIDGIDLSFPLVVKAMVLTGGRGKRGGVRLVDDRAAARAAAAEILALEIGGLRVGSVLLEEAVPHTGSAYIGVTTSPDDFQPVLLASPRGGVDVEQAAKDDPDAVLRLPVPDNDPVLPPPLAARAGEFLARGLPGAPAPALADAAARLYAVFQALDAKVAEINPLLCSPDRGPVAADAKIVLDDNALYRQAPRLRRLGIAGARHDASELTPDEKRARDAGFKYVDLLPVDARRDPDLLYVGLVPGGAGYGIFSIDEVANVGDRHFGGRAVPVNFMDSGGGPAQATVAEMFHLLMDKEIVDVVVTSRFGGISSCDVFIRGLVQCLRDRHARGARVVPVHGRMVGTDLPGARAFLERARTETPEALRRLTMEVGNRRIMAEVIRDALAAAFAERCADGRR